MLLDAFRTRPQRNLNGTVVADGKLSQQPILVKREPAFAVAISVFHFELFRKCAHTIPDWFALRWLKIGFSQQNVEHMRHSWPVCERK